MAWKTSLLIAVIISLSYGIGTFDKFYHCISPGELLLLIFLRMIGTFIIFFASGVGICFFVKQQIPQKVKKSTKIDYVLPSVPPISAVTEGKAEIKENLSEATETKASAEALAMTIRTLLAQE